MSKKSASARFRHRERRLPCDQLPNDHRLEILTRGGENGGRQFRPHDRVSPLERLRRTDQSQVDFAHSRAVAQLEPGDREQLRADRFLNMGFPIPTIR